MLITANAKTTDKHSLHKSTSKKPSSEIDKLTWLRSELIGSGVSTDTPFGSRLLTYADHTASGRCLQYIEDYIINHVLPFYGNTHTTDSYVGNKTTNMVNEATDYIKKCVGAGPDDALIFSGSGATAAIKRLQEVMGIAVPSIMRERVVENLRREERWVVFVGPYEHHSNLLTWRQSTAEVVEIGMDEEGLVDLEELRVELGSSKYAGRPMLGSFSACSNVTGIVTDTRALARVLHSHGAFACFDFATSAPYVKIDMRSGDIEGYDAVFISPHKFLGGPGSPGILVMNKSLYQLSSSPPSTCGGGTVSYVAFSDQDTIYHEDIEEREDAGTPPIILKIRAALAFWVKDYIGHDLIDRHERRNVKIALERLLSNPNIRVLGNTNVSRLPIISFLVFPPNGANGPLNGRFVAKLLSDVFGIQSRGGCNCAGPYGHRLLGHDEAAADKIRSMVKKGYEGAKPGWTRVSFAYYMSKEEIEFILDAIEFIAAYGHRFLPLYHSNMMTGDWTYRDLAFVERDIRKVKITSSLSTTSGFLKKCRKSLKKVAKQGRRSRKIGMEEESVFASYLESARRVALSLPDHQGIEY